MYIGHIQFGSLDKGNCVQVLFWTRRCLFRHGYMPPDGEFKGKVMQYWMTPLFEIRMFAR